jgi:hypothetical protein
VYVIVGANGYNPLPMFPCAKNSSFYLCDVPLVQ